MMKVDAYVLENRKLRKVWRWTNERAPFMYQGQGQHTLKTGDIDGDGMDEIINGSLAIDNDGKTMWGTGLGHGDRSYMGDIDPDNPGWEIWYTIEEPQPRNGACLVDARTGRIIFGADEPNGDNEFGSCMAASSDPNAGMTSNDFTWAIGGGIDINITKNLAVRPAQFDFGQIRSDMDNVNLVGYSAGVVVKF